jgi:hypothetical protein
MIASCVAIIIVYMGFSLFFLWIIKSFSTLHDKYGTFGFILMMLLIGGLIYGLLWGMFKALCILIVGYTIMIAPPFGWAFKFIIVVSSIMCLYTISAIWLSPSQYNTSSVVYCLFGTWLCIGFTVNMSLVAAAESEEQFT